MITKRIFILLVSLLVGVLTTVTDYAEARRGGRFLSGFTRGMTHGLSKSYGSDVLTQKQLENCLRQAAQLDQNDTYIESGREQISAKFTQLE
jgi:hypothetical protein